MTELRRPSATSYELKPLGAGLRGFADGTWVTCSSDVVYRVQASDDTERGELCVSMNSRLMDIYLYDVDTVYDVDTAELLNAQPSALKSATTRNF